jgi:uncharacterized membrane protein YvlD (DUF360 family)
MVFWPLTLLLGAVVLRLVAAVLPGLKIDGWIDALLAVAVMSIGSWILALVPATMLPAGLFPSIAALLIVNLVSLALAAVVLPGIHVEDASAHYWSRPYY